MYFPLFYYITDEVQSSSSAGKKLLENCLSIVNSLIKSDLLGKLKGNEKSSNLVNLLSDMELMLVGFQFELDDSDPTKTSKISSQMDEWRESMVETSSGGLPSDIRNSLSKVLNAVHWSIISDLSILGELNGRIKRYRKDMERAMRSHETFVRHLTGHLDKELDIIQQTVRTFKDCEEINPWSLGSHKNRHQRLLVEKQIDIWMGCFPKTNPLTSKDPLAFLQVLLASSSSDKTALRLTIAADLLCDHIETPESVNVLEDWCNLLAKNQNIAAIKQITLVQNALVGHFSVFQTRQLHKNKQGNGRSMKFNCKEIVEQLTSVSRFLSKSDIEVNQLLLIGLLKLAKAFDDSSRPIVASPFVAEYVQYLFSSKIVGTNVKKKAILDALFSDSQKLFSPREKAYMERWLKTEACWVQTDPNPLKSNPLVTTLYEQIQKVNKEQKSYSSSSENRLISSAGFEILFTNEEKKYVAILGKEGADEVFRIQHPSFYLPILKERAANQIYRKLILHFYPNADETMSDLLQTHEPRKTNDDASTNTTSDAENKRANVIEFQRIFDRAYFFAKRNATEFGWLLWLQATVIKSLVSIPQDKMPLANITELIFSVTEFSLEQLYISTGTSRPQNWVDDVLVRSIMNAITQIQQKTKPEANGSSDEDQLKRQHWDLTANLYACAKSTDSRAVLNIFLRKLEQEARLVAAAEPVDPSFIAELITGLKALKKIDKVERFQDSSFRQWPRIIRHAKFSQIWPPGLTNQLTTILDRRLGPQKTDRFLQRFNSKYGQEEPTESQQKMLEEMLKNLSKYPWIVDQFFILAREEDELANGSDDDYYWQLIQNRELIEEDKRNASQSNLNVDQLLEMMRNDPESKSIIGNSKVQEKFIQQIEEIKLLALNSQRSQWTFDEIKSWTREIKDSGKGVDPIDFLSVAFQAVKLKMNYHLRDAQMLAVLIFVSPPTGTNDRKVGRRMAQISTGEGKTQITALLVSYHVLNNWSNGRRFVDIITSSSVLAEANVLEMKWFYDVFQVGVENNCYAACTDDENLRSRR